MCSYSSSTIISVDTGVWYVDCARAHGPRQSEGLSRVLDYPVAGGEVVPGVIVAVPTKAWERDWKWLQLDLTGLIAV